MTVIEFPKKDEPHIEGPTKCMACGYKGHSVAPVGVSLMECPECETEKLVFELMTGPIGGDRWVCNCGCDLFYILPTGLQCTQCATVQEFGDHAS